VWIGVGAVALGVAAYYIFKDHANGGDVANKVLSGEFYKEYKDLCTKTADEFRKQGRDDLAKQWEKQPVTISNVEADKFAQRLYNATKGGILGLGIGTDETEIRDVLVEIPTCVDVSFVSVKFEKTYQGAWSFEPNLLAVFNEELSPGEFSMYVESPLADKMDTALINIFGAVKGQDAWVEYLEISKEVADEAENLAREAISTGVVTDAAAAAGDTEATDRDENKTYTMEESDPWEYKVSKDTGCWLTRKKEVAPLGAFKSLGRNRRATRILDRQFPDARTEDEKADCPATGGGSVRLGGGGRRGSISTKGADERAKRLISLEEKKTSDIVINVYGKLRENENIEQFVKDLKRVVVDTLPPGKQIDKTYSVRINTGAGGRIKQLSSQLKGLDTKGLSVQLKGMITGFRRNRGTIDITIPAGDYLKAAEQTGQIDEGVELKALIKKLSRKV